MFYTSNTLQYKTLFDIFCIVGNVDLIEFDIIIRYKEKNIKVKFLKMNFPEVFQLDVGRL